MESTSDLKSDIIGKEATSSRVHLLFAVFAGAVIGWPSPMIPRLNLSSTENSFLSSLFSLGAAPGPFITTFGIDTIGRKGTLYVISSTFIVSWVLLLCSQKVVVMYLARLIGGIGIGGAFGTVSVYVAEICDEATRGPVGSLLQTFIALGLLVEYIIGPFVSYTVLAVVSLLVTVFFIVMFFFAPESPHYLLSKGKINEASKAIAFLRGPIHEEDINKEIAYIQGMINQEKGNDTGVRKLFTSCAVHKGMAICIFLLMMQQGSGINAVLAYVQFIFEKANLELSPEVVPILVGVTNLVSSLPAPFFVRKFGNRIVFTFSILGCGLCLCFLGLYFYLVHNAYDVSNIGFFPVTSVILYNVFFCLGIGPLVWGVAAVLFSPSVKGVAMGICGIFSAIFGFFAIQVFSNVLQTYGFITVFFGFGVYLLLGGIGSWFIIPDTSRMSLQEIQDYLEGKSK